MSDTTWGVKVPEELKEKLSSTMQEEGLSGKEFIETLYRAYEISKLKEAQPVMKADLEELQLLTSRIYSIFAGLGERLDNITKAKEAEYKVEIDGKIGTINMYYSKIKELEALSDDLKKDKASIEIHSTEVENRNKELQEIAESNKALISEYKEKNDTLTGLLNEYKEYKISNEQLKIEMQKMQKDYDNMELRASKAGSEIEQINQKLEATAIKHKEDVEHVRSQAELDKGNAILNLRDEYQSKIVDMQKRIADIQDEHSTKVKALLEHIEKTQNSKDNVVIKKNDKKAVNEKDVNRK